MHSWARRLLVRLRSGRPLTRDSPRPSLTPLQPSPPSPGFLGERIYYKDSRGRPVEASCVDVSTDWVPLFDVEVIDHGEVLASYKGIRGYTALKDLVESRGWIKRDRDQRILEQKFAAARKGSAPPGTA
jgi:hypothetical protein